MDTKQGEKRWPLTFIIITAAVIASAAIIYSYRDTPGRLPVSAVSDGSNGVIVAWQNDGGIYAQRVDSSGHIKWPRGGVLIGRCSSVSGCSLTPDGLGGAIITWGDASGHPDDHDNPAFFDPIPFYAQRISSDGNLLWGNSPISTGQNREVAPDGADGAILAWNDYQTYSKGLHDDYLRLQKVAPDGRLLWNDEGVLVVASSPYHPITEEEIARGIKGTITRSRPTYEGDHDIVNDGNGGAIVFWEEETEYDERRIYAQRIDSDGEPVWPDMVLALAGQEYHLQSVASDGNGGAIIAVSSRLQRVSSDGELSWAGGGIATHKGYSPNLESNGSGDIILFRIEDYPPTGPPWERGLNLYIQKMDMEGRYLWQEEPVFRTEKGQHFTLDIAAVDNGAILSWRLYQLETGSYSAVAYGEILAQKLDASGNMTWSEENIVVFADTEVKFQGPPEVISDGSGGAIVIASLGKGAIRGDMIYAQRLDVDGNRLWGGGIRIDQ